MRFTGMKRKRGNLKTEVEKWKQCLQESSISFLIVLQKQQCDLSGCDRAAAGSTHIETQRHKAGDFWKTEGYMLQDHSPSYYVLDRFQRWMTPPP